MAAVAIAAASLFALSEYALRRTYTLPAESLHLAGAGDAAEGWRLAKLYGCTSCHGADYRGLRYNADPALVRNHAPNLTLIAARHSDAELGRAIRQGVSAESGRALWNMPSATFATVTDAELADVLAHLRSLPVGGAPTPRDTPGLAARLAILRGLFGAEGVGVQRSAPALVDAARQHPPFDAGPAHDKGRHIASTVCSECHGRDLAGDALEGGVDLTIVGAYSPESFRHLMRTGIAPGGRDLGLMSEVARDDLKVFTDAEIDALHGYLVARAQALTR